MFTPVKAALSSLQMQSVDSSHSLYRNLSSLHAINKWPVDLWSGLDYSTFKVLTGKGQCLPTFYRLHN